MIQKSLPVLIFFLFFFLFLIPVQDTDFGWHLRCGQEILEQGKLCQTNHFTTLLDNYKWNSPAHLYQILIFLTFKYFGFPGLTFLYGLTAAAVFTFFMKSFGRNLILNTIVTLVGIWFAWSTLKPGIRSQILSIYFLLIFLSIVKLSQTRPKLLYTLPVLMMIWSSSHSGFFLGLIASLFLFLDTLIKCFLKTSKQKYLITITILTGLNFLASLVNPYGWLIYQEVLRHGQVALNTLIAEWVPPQAWQIFLVISVGVWLSSLAWRRKDFFSILLLAFSAYLTVLARRNLPIFSVSAIYATIISLSENFDSSLIKKPIQKAWAMILFTALIFFAYKKLPTVLAFDENIYCQKSLVVLPCRGVGFMTKQKPGNIFNAYEWGGYLIWKLPQFKIFTDGRMPTWDTAKEENLPQNWRGKSPYTIYIETLQNLPGWQEVLASYHSDYLMIQPGTFMDLLLKDEPREFGYENIYNDGVATIYRKI